MSEPCLHILRGDRFKRLAQRGKEFLHRPRFEFAQDRFHFRPAEFNRIQVRRIGRQEFQVRPTGSDLTLDGFALVHVQVVNQQDVPRSQSGGEDCPDIGFKRLLRHRTLQEPRRIDFIKAQGGNQGVVLAGIAGCAFGNTFAWGSAPEQAGQP